jgi:hypothetical protein
LHEVFACKKNWNLLYKMFKTSNIYKCLKIPNWNPTNTLSLGKTLTLNTRKFEFKRIWNKREEGFKFQYYWYLGRLKLNIDTNQRWYDLEPLPHAIGLYFHIRKPKSHAKDNRCRTVVEMWTQKQEHQISEYDTNLCI